MKTILVIEDDRTIRTQILKVLEQQGFEVLAAAEGKTGVQLAREMLPDMILCDILMPGPDGFQVLEVLQREPITASIPLSFDRKSRSLGSASRHDPGGG